MNPAISILIRTFNSAGTLPSVLDRLELQPEDEIIIVDSGSTDATLAIAGNIARGSSSPNRRSITANH